MDLKHLKSGTDIRGIALGEHNNLTDDVIKKLVFGFVNVLEEKTNISPSKMKVSVGFDSRLSSERIRKCVENSLLSLGVDCVSCGMSSTPAMFMTTIKLGCTGAIQITASHLPYDKNGLKFFTKDGGFEGSDIDKIIGYAENLDAYPYSQPGKIEKVKFMSRYAQDLRSMILKALDNGDKPLKNIHIIVDAGNGVGGFYATQVLEPLGADISHSQFLEPDGNFPNHIPNPEDKTAMKSICDAVKEHNADLGVIFDTDVDRAACVDSNGNEINRNRLVALASAIVLEDYPGGTIVTDSVTSDGLKTFIEELGGKHHRFKRGYKNVINEAIRLNDNNIEAPLAIETSGHAAFKENYFLDDGAYLITKIIIKFAQLRKEDKDISDLLISLKEPKEAIEYRLKILDSDFRTYGNNVIKELENYSKQFDFITIANDNHEGIRLSFDKNKGNGWLLLRLSVHDPILPLNIESNEFGGAAKIKSVFVNFIKKFDKLDISCFETNEL
jgi:phosphomannomutase